MARDPSRVLLVELKTDDASRRGSQDDYLVAAERLGFGPIVAEIRHDDPISQRFAASLRAWRFPAGSTPPR